MNELKKEEVTMRCARAAESDATAGASAQVPSPAPPAEVPATKLAALLSPPPAPAIRGPILGHTTALRLREERLLRIVGKEHMRLFCFLKAVEQVENQLMPVDLEDDLTNASGWQDVCVSMWRIPRTRPARPNMAWRGAGWQRAARPGACSARCTAGKRHGMHMCICGTCSCK